MGESDQPTQDADAEATPHCVVAGCEETSPLLTPVKFEVDGLVFDVHICSEHYKPIGLEAFSIGPIVATVNDICTCPPFGHDFWCKNA